MKIISIFVSITLITAGVPSWSAEALPEATANLPTPMQIYCAPNANPKACVGYAGWHWLRKAVVVFDPSLKTLEFSVGAWSMTMIAKWVGGDAPAVQYILQISRAGMQAGAIGLLAGAAMAVLGTIFTAGSFLMSMVTPAGGPGDELPSGCAELTAPYDSPEGLKKLLQLPEDQYQQVIRCLPKDNALGELADQSARNAALLEQSAR